MPSKKNYQQLHDELDAILDWFAQTDDASVDEAIAHYKKGGLIITELRKQLELAKNQIKDVEI